MNLTQLLDQQRLPRLGESAPPSAWLEPPSPPAQVAVLQSAPGALSQFSLQMVRILQELQADLRLQSAAVLKLNPSRRDALLETLNRSSTEALGDLKAWVSAHLRSPTQESVLERYLEEAAFVWLGQALLLRQWSAEGRCAFHAADLEHLNFRFTQILRSYLPQARENWHLARQNLYSWYNPSASLHTRLWDFLQATPAHPDVRTQFFSALLQIRKIPMLDSRFFDALWKTTSSLQRGTQTYAFTPTLREAGFLEHAPNWIDWVGLESDPFLLLAAEIRKLFAGPMSPPLWSLGTGLEVHSRDQLALQWNAPKQCTLQSISEMEACDLAIVIDHPSVRLSDRTPAASELRKKIDTLPYFNRLKSPEVSLGALQACVAITKLRPSGKLWWIRDHAVQSSEGEPVLRFLLEHAKLLCRWDLSELQHSLPGSDSLLPKQLLLFERESLRERREEHRPIEVQIHGTIRSHIEVPRLLEDVFSAQVETPETQGSSWKLHRQQSSVSQREWEGVWPDPIQLKTLERVDRLRRNSVPLSQVVNLHPFSERSPKRGVLVSLVSRAGRPELRARPWSLSTAGEEAKFVLLHDSEEVLGLLSAYLESPPVSEWLEVYCERRKSGLALSESTLRVLPVPDWIGTPERMGALSALPHPARQTLDQIAIRPENVWGWLDQVPADEDLRELYRTHLIRACAREIVRSRQNLEHYKRMIASDGSIAWRELIEVLPETETHAFSVHRSLQIQGSLPLHSPIEKKDFLRTSHVIVLTTDRGHQARLLSENRQLLEALWQQIEPLSHPTWNEMTALVRLPRDFESAQSSANDILESYGHQLRLQERWDQILRGAWSS